MPNKSVQCQKDLQKSVNVHPLWEYNILQHMNLKENKGKIFKKKKKSYQTLGSSSCMWAALKGISFPKDVGHSATHQHLV